MSKEELHNYFDVLSKEHSDFMQNWLETRDNSELDEYLSHLTEEEKDALFILLIIKFTKMLKGDAKNKLDYEVINRGKCMLCGKELTEGLFFCKECEQKGDKK